MGIRFILKVKWLRCLIPLFSLAGACAILIFCNIRWHYLNKRNDYLELKAQRSHDELFKVSKKFDRLYKDRRWLTKQVWVLSKGKKHLKHREQLKKLIKERNIKYKIGDKPFLLKTQRVGVLTMNANQEEKMIVNEIVEKAGVSQKNAQNIIEVFRKQWIENPVGLVSLLHPFPVVKQIGKKKTKKKATNKKPAADKPATTKKTTTKKAKKTGTKKNKKSKKEKNVSLKKKTKDS